MQRPDPGKQFLEGKWLREIVIGPDVETGHAIGHGISGSQHQHRGDASLPPQGPTHVEAISPGQQQIQDDQIVRVGRGQFQPRLAVRGDLDRIPLFLEPAPEKLADLPFILDDQDAHDRTAPIRSHIHSPSQRTLHL